MKKLLKKLGEINELTILNLDKAKMTYGGVFGSISYDHSASDDSSTSYDDSGYNDSSTDHD